MLLPDSVCLSVCLCMSARLLQKLQMDLDDIFVEDCGVTQSIRLWWRSRSRFLGPDHDLDTGNLLKDFLA